MQGLAEIVDKENVYQTRCRHKVDTYKKRMLTLMVESPDISEGTHYEGVVSLSNRGKPIMNQHNLQLKITPQGALVLFGSFINDASRVQLLNDVFIGMQKAAEMFASMKMRFDEYTEKLKSHHQQRKEAYQKLKKEVCEKLEIDPRAADTKMLSVTKRMQKSYFGEAPTTAMRHAGILGQTERAGNVSQQFSPFGHAVDDFRMHMQAQAIRIHAAEFNAAPDDQSKKRKMKEVEDLCYNHWETSKCFRIPGASDVENTRAYFNKAPISKRQRI